VTTISATTTWSRRSRTAKTRTGTTTTSTTRTEVPFAFGLGANLGDARSTLEEALRRLGRRFGPLRVAPYYRTEPLSHLEQPDFLNTVATGRTAEAPEKLHAFARQLERELGRRSRPPGSAREIDLDLLFVGNELRTGSELTLPHPRLRDRRFVLAPLADLVPNLPLPPDGATPAQLLALLPAGQRVELLVPGDVAS